MPYVHDTLERLKKTSPAQAELYQAADEVLDSLRPLLDQDPRYHDHGIIERIVEPERQIMFRVCWQDDAGRVRVNKGHRVQFNSALGPYKGGLRFHPSVNARIVKFLGFEQIFKNALAREIGYPFGQYKRLTSRYEGVLTGKGLDWGCSLGRKEATGYGAVYFAQTMLAARGDTLDGKTCLVSGAGNVAIYTIEKLYQLGALPVTCSDSQGSIHHRAGIDLATLKHLKEVKRTSLREYVEHHPDAMIEQGVG